jgi:DNA phosphorothioation-dependent restriction protein DptH
VRTGPSSCDSIRECCEGSLEGAPGDRQLQNTKRVLESRFFATDPPRTDIKLQLARLASVLHYYADRSVVHEIIAEEKAGEVHRYMDRVTENHVPAEISMRGVRS